MNITLRKASLDDAKLLHTMQVESFMPLYERYRDHDTSPANEPLERLTERLKQGFTDYYVIMADEKPAGGIRIVKLENRRYRVSPVFVAPAYQGHGIAQEVFHQIEQLYRDATAWELTTILEERGNCYLYEKLGYRQKGELDPLSDVLTQIHYEKLLTPIDSLQLRLVPAAEDDYEWLFWAHKEAFAWLAIKVWGKWEEAFQRQVFADEYKGTEPILVLYRDEKVASYTLTKRDGRYDFGNFFVMPAYRDRGIGTFVMETVLKTVDEEGLPTRLIYWDFNPAGHLYTRFGFRQVGRHDFEGRDDYWVIVERPVGGTV